MRGPEKDFINADTNLLLDIVGITLTCDITGNITGNAGVREWPIGICGHEQGSLKWPIGITRGG